jgi:hypothetical protein
MLTLMCDWNTHDACFGMDAFRGKPIGGIQTVWAKLLKEPAPHGA